MFVIRDLSFVVRRLRPGSGRGSSFVAHRSSFVVRRRLAHLLTVALLIALLLGSRQAHAQTPKKERAFVYGINAAFATNYVGTFAPDSAPAIYLLADQISVISPRITEIYFWPITNEYQADWTLVNEPVPGKLEILRSGQLIATIDPTKYTIQFTPRGTTTDARLYLGAEAEQAQAQFKAKQDAYQKASGEYLEAQRQWTAAMDAAIAQRAAGKNVTVPPEPQPPAPIDIFSNGLNDGFPIKLTPGSYQIHLRSPDGTIAPRSRRDLVVFAPRRVAVGYTVVPETRWTTPDQVTDLSDVILGAPGSNLYLQPHVTREYLARAYALLQDPQAHDVETSEWTWVSGEPLNDGQLEVVVGGQVVDRRALTPYRVRQLADTALGYEVQPYVPGEASSRSSPDFIAYPIRLETSGMAYSVRMVSPQGTAIDGSGRLVRAPIRAAFSELLLLPAAPLIVGAFVILRRRRRMRLPRDVVK
ncbi:MAG TPA: hypothetical protein VKE41_16570 [Roseiflexaceae bacterium]|nr:hypothetical protein [Roseiflexaceae bacterium]